MVKRRQLRLGQLLRGVIANTILSDLKDPRLRGMITVVRVDLSSDYADAKVFVSVFGTEIDQRTTLRALDQSIGVFKNAIRHQCNLRIIPKLNFVLDHSLRKAQEFNELLSRAMDGIQTDDSRDNQELDPDLSTDDLI